MKLFFNVFVLLFISLSFIFAESEYEKIQRKAAKKVVKKQIDAIENEIVLDILLLLIKSMYLNILIIFPHLFCCYFSCLD